MKVSRSNRPAGRRLAGIRPSFGCESLEARRLLAAGGLDPSFGGDGDVTNGFLPATTTSGFDVAVQADGKTVVVGAINPHDGFAVTRYNLNGTADTTFGPNHDGTVFTRFSAPSFASGVAIQPDGKIVVVGKADDDETRVVRYNPDGALDKSFDYDGVFGFKAGDILDHVNFHEIVVQLDGRILLGGDGLTGVISPNDDIAFARLNPNGAFDTSFGSFGIRIKGFGNNETLGGIAIDYTGTPATNPDYGKIVVAANRYNDDFSQSVLLMARLTTGGDFDDTYDGDGLGVVRYPGAFSTGTTGVVLQDDGRVVVAANTGNRMALVRFEHGGPLDTTFGPDGTGWATCDPAVMSGSVDVAISPSGGLIVGGYKGSGAAERDVVAYFTADGRPDTRFGGGVLSYAFGGDRALAVGPGRRFVFAGGYGMHAARFFDVGANLVYAATLNPTAFEAGSVSRGFFVYRQERLPVATRVYFTVGGTATAPTGKAVQLGVHDYVVDGLVFPASGAAYADIPADATFTVVTLTPRNDRDYEGNETAEFTVRTDTAYDVGDPRNVRLVIVDDEAPPPTVAQVYVRGSAWKGTDGDADNITFKEYLAANSLGDAEYGYRVDNAVAATLPWTNANQLVLRYTAPPTGAGVPAVGGVGLDGVRSDYAVTAVDPLDATTFLLTLDRPLGALPAAQGGGSDGDRVTLSVPAAGPGGGPYTLALNTLPGDADRAGAKVNALDLGFMKARSNRTAPEPAPAAGLPYTASADLNADGRINALDLGALKARLNDALPDANAVSAAATAAGSVPVLGDRRDEGTVFSRPADLLI